MSTLPESKLVKHQVQTFTRLIGAGQRLNVKVRYDDECCNNHNTFAITGELLRYGKWQAFGCLHDDIAKHFPELAKYIKWHLVSSDGPMHYIANSLYCAEKGDLEAFRRCAMWPTATELNMSSPNLKPNLKRRLPKLMLRFKAAMEELGFVY